MAENGRVRWGNVVTVASATLLIATETLATATAAAWALGGLFRLGEYGEYGLMALFGAFALYLTFLYLRRAASAEPIFER